MAEIVEEEIRLVSTYLPPKVWNDFHDRIVSKFGKKKARTGILIELIQRYVSDNSVFLFPISIKVDVESEYNHILEMREEFKPEPRKQTSIEVPSKLWDDFDVVIRRKLGASITKTDVVLMLISDYMELTDQ